MPDIYVVWNSAGYAEPSVEEQFGNGQPNRTIVRLPLVTKEGFSHISEKGAKKGAKESARVEERKLAVYEAICANPDAKI